MTATVLHIPHASRVIPPEERARYIPSDTRLAEELLRMTDAWTDELVAGIAATRIIFPLSRLVIDVERFPDDADEPMAARGMGAMYTQLSTGEPLRHADPAHRAALMAQLYWPHHGRLAEAVDAVLVEHGRCLIVDVHSFPSSPLPHELVQDPGRPEICIGTDAFHTPFAADEDALRACALHGFTAALNTPFAGSIVPTGHWQRTPAVRSVMIEVRRDLYMDETTGERSPRFAEIAGRVCRLVESLIELAARAWRGGLNASETSPA